jgi:hypothetical protein
MKMKFWVVGFLIGVALGVTLWNLFLTQPELKKEIALRDEYKKELNAYRNDPILRQIKAQLDDMRLKRIEIDIPKVNKVEEFLTKHRGNR